MSWSAISPPLLLGMAGWIGLLLLWALWGWQRFRPGQQPGVAVLLAGAVLTLLPAWVLRGAFGDSSLTTTLLALVLLAQRLRSRPVLPVLPLPVALVLLVAGVALYLSALGPWPFDLYALGDHREGLAWLLPGWLVVAALAQWRGSLLGWVWPAAAALHALGGSLSPNLWDALLDPWLVLAAAWVLLSWPWRRSGAAAATARTASPSAAR